MRLIADGAVERSGVSGLATSLGYSERHLNRLLTDEVGAGPLAIARAQRAQTSRQLIETTDMAVTDVAFAAGFGSVRQFNDTIREVFAATPTELRDAAKRRRLNSPARDEGAAPGEVTLRLPVRQPFAGLEVLDFLSRRMIPGVECSSRSHTLATYRRTLALPGGIATVTLSTADDAAHVEARLRLADWTDLATAVQRLRRLLDLDSDPAAVDERLGQHPTLARLVAVAPGRRSPGSADPFETLVRAIVGQQISVAGARTVTGRLVAAVGEPIDDAQNEAQDDELTHAFPSAEAVAAAPDAAFSMPAARRDTIRRSAAAVASGEVELHAGVDPDAARAQLLALKGIGPWTADYVMMRGLGHPDVFLGGDLGVMHALRALGVNDLPAADSAAWAPWRSYATHHLWASLDVSPPVPNNSNSSTASSAKVTS